MEILGKYTVYSHTPGFRKFGRAWKLEPVTVGTVEALPKGGSGSRTHDDVDLLITEQELENLFRLNREEAYPLRISEGATDSTARQTREARKKLDRINEAIKKAGQERAEAEKAAKAAQGKLEELRAELAELRDAVEAAEAQARKKEAEAEKLKKDIEALKKGGKPDKKAPKSKPAEGAARG